LTGTGRNTTRIELNKKVLIISPYFPPSNAADMHRVRMSLPYLKSCGWDAEVISIDPHYSEIIKDDLLLQSIPESTKVHRVKALSKKWTSKLGLGSIALRSLSSYKKKGNQLLKKGNYDLVYFSTTQFPVCVLGAYWKKRFGVPYVIDMQDPWHSEYYRDKPKHEQPPKYWFSYRLNKYLEGIAMKQVDGLISVSEKYITDLKSRYPVIKDIPSATIPFGAFAPDLKIAVQNQAKFDPLLAIGHINIVYIGRGGADMAKAVSALFSAFKTGMASEPQSFKKTRFYFIGTSYAPEGQGKPSIAPIAKQFGLEENVVEITDRISYYQTLAILQNADALFIPGSDDPKYSASKIYPYLLTKKPLLAIFNSKSPALSILKDYGAEYAYSYDETPGIELKINSFIKQVMNGQMAVQNYDNDVIRKYAAENLAKLQCELFNQVINKKDGGASSRQV
jgi:hypothetical protein